MTSTATAPQLIDPTNPHQLLGFLSGNLIAQMSSIVTSDEFKKEVAKMMIAELKENPFAEIGENITIEQAAKICNIDYLYFYTTYVLRGVIENKSKTGDKKTAYFSTSKFRQLIEERKIKIKGKR